MIIFSRLTRLRPLIPISIRNVSRFASIIESEGCKKYCNDIVEKFNNIKTGGSDSLVDGMETDAISRWQKIADIDEQLKSKADELKQLKEMEKG